MKLICLLKHKWKVTAVNNRKHNNLLHLHQWAGCKVECERCRKLYFDDTNGFRDDWIDVHLPEHLRR